MNSLDAPSPRFSLRRGSAPPPLSSAQSSLLQQHHRTYLQGSGGGNSNSAIPTDNLPSHASHPASSSSSSGKGGGALGLLSHLVGKRKSSSSSQQPPVIAASTSYESQTHAEDGGGGGVMVLKVLSEEDAVEEGSSPSAAAAAVAHSDHAVSDFASGVGGDDDTAGAGAVEVAIPEEGGPGAAALLNLDSVKDLLRCSWCRRFLFPPIVQCLRGHMQCRPCLTTGRSQCAKCQQDVLEVPAKLAEAVAEQFRVRCSFAEKGCPETVQFKHRRQHEEVCQFKPVQCPEFDCAVTKPINEIFRHFRLQHHQHFVNAHGSLFNGDIRCDDVNMVMGLERKWAPTMLKLEGGPPLAANSGGGGGVSNGGGHNHHDGGEAHDDAHDAPAPHTMSASKEQHFFLEILRTKHGVWHMWVWYLGEAAEAALFRCEIAVRRRGGLGGGGLGGRGAECDQELKYSGRVHSIRVPPHRVILSGCLLSFSDYTAAQFRYLGDGHQGHPVIDYRVSVSHTRKQSSSGERAMAVGLTKMLRRFSTDVSGSNSGGGGGKAGKAAASGIMATATAE